MNMVPVYVKLLSCQTTIANYLQSPAKPRRNANHVITVVRSDPSLQDGRVGRRDGSSGRLIDQSKRPNASNASKVVRTRPTTKACAE
jgi:hypothetical protein